MLKMLIIAIFIGKMTIVLLQLLGRTGSALPGLIVEKLYPKFLSECFSQLPKGVVVISGTNGKTTTTKIIVELLESQNLKVITNSTGSNFVRGIISSVLRRTSLKGILDYDIAVIELDEAHAVRFTKFVKPNGFVGLNIMRDQMDRFGEIDTTARLLKKVANSTTDFLVLNANDPRIAKLDDVKLQKDLVWYGHSKNLVSDFASDDEHYTKEKAVFFQANEPDVLLEKITKQNIVIKYKQKKYEIDLRLEGTHNAINAIAGLTTVIKLLPDTKFVELTNALSKIEPAFGRGEKVVLDSGQTLRLQLVKNPASFTHSLRMLNESIYDKVAIVINDNFADSRDVSWLWDVDFSKIENNDIWCGGTRAYDMALRLKYDEKSSSFMETDLEKFVKNLCNSKNQNVVVFCTYTAMIRIRRLLKSYSKELKEVGV